MKGYRKIIAFTMALMLVFSGTAFAATEQDIIDSTDAGMAWLAEQQTTTAGIYFGSWGSSDRVGRTGLALLKFETHALNSDDPIYESPFDPTYEYSTTVAIGLDYIFGQAIAIAITTQAGVNNPDTNGNGMGIKFQTGGHEIYNSSIALMAIVASGTPERVVNVTGSAVNGWTYGDVAQEIVDFLAYAQNEIGTGRGGWRYSANYSSSDNSISGYASMALAFAEHPVYGFECDIPVFVKTELEIWINYIQNANGGSGYEQPNNWVNLLKTGNLLQQMAFVGIPKADQRMQDAIGYIESNWNASAYEPGWRKASGASGYQTTFTLMKGLESYNIELIDIGGDFDWFDDIADELLDEQLGDDSWPQTNWDTSDRILSTTWALLTLQKVAPPAPIIEVDVDVKPGSDSNAIKLKGKGVLPVAILGSEDFDASDVSPSSVLLIHPTDAAISASALRWNLEDVDSDGYLDMIFHFAMEDVILLIVAGDEEIMLIGETTSGLPFEGSDSIVTVPKE